MITYKNDIKWVHHVNISIFTYLSCLHSYVVMPIDQWKLSYSFQCYCTEPPSQGFACTHARHYLSSVALKDSLLFSFFLLLTFSWVLMVVTKGCLGNELHDHPPSCSFMTITKVVSLPDWLSPVVSSQAPCSIKQLGTSLGKPSFLNFINLFVLSDYMYIQIHI